MMAMDKTASIVYLCDYQAPYGGNFIASMLRLDEALSKHGVAVCYVFPKGAKDRDWCGEMERRGREVRFLPEGGSVEKLRALLQILDECRATILHVHFGFFPLGELAAILRPKLRLILHFHSDFSGGRAPGVRQRVKSFLTRMPEALIGKRLQKITVSEWSARTTADCISLHNALCEERFVDKSRDRAQVRETYCVPEDATLVMVFGWSPWIKGVDVAAEAVRLLHARGQDQFILGIVCGRTCTSEKMREFLRERTACTGDEPWIRYLPPKEDVFGYHKAADIFVSASRSETFSYALLEAICTGRPCVCSQIPGVSWASEFDTVGFYPTEEAGALADVLTKVAAERNLPEMTARLERAAAQARASYAIEDWINGMLGIYGL